MDLPDVPDADVIERARHGDKDALTALFRAYQPALLRYARGRLPDAAQDLAAQTWLDTARSLHRFQGGPDDFRRWLFTIARRRVQDELRRRSRRPTELAPQVPEDASEGDPMGEHDELARAIALVRRLPPDQADAVLLRIVGGMDVGQVAEVMGKSEGAVRVLVHRGLRRLRELVERVTWILA
jgi:RNA polymerase sigma-70 factor (ECF subfamily)